MAIADQLCQSFLDLWWHFDPAAATRAGVSGHDGRLGAFDAESVRQHVAALRSIAGVVEDLDIEDTDEEIDRTALLDHLRVLLFRFEHEHPYQRNPALWIEHAGEALDGLLARPGDDADAVESALARLAALPRFFADARATLRRPPLFLVETALAQLDGLALQLDATAAHFSIRDAAMLGEAAASVDRMREALGSTITPDPAPGAAAIGEDEVDRRLHFEHASVHNGAEVWRASLRLVTEAEQEVVALAAAIDPGAPWREVYQRARDAAEDSTDLCQAYSGAIGAALRFAAVHELAAPPRVSLEVVTAPAYARVLEPIAFYRPTGGKVAAAVVVAGGDQIAIPWRAARLGAPGIHLHSARCNALVSLVRRHIAASSTPRGWGLYAVELMRSKGFAPEPASVLAERVEFLRHAHLALVDVGLHTRQLTPLTAIGHLTAHLPVDQRTALADVRRIACRPMEACAAILGRGELHRLRDDVRAARGAEFTLEQFHHDLFAFGGLPVPLIRWGLGLDG